MPKKTWYGITNKAGNQPEAEISIYDDIGAWGVTAKDFITDLKAIHTEVIRLEISSLGGSVFDALAMFNALRAHPAKIHAKVMGVAASAASYVLMAADTIEMPENAFLMVHNPLSDAFGNAEALRDMAEVLDKFGNALIGTYVARSGQPEEKVRELLDAETWLSATEAKALGFIDQITASLKVTACFEQERVPEAVRAVFQAAAAPAPEASPATAPPPEQDASVPAALTTLAAQHGLLAHVGMWLSDATIRDAVTAEAVVNDAVAIRTLCADAKHDALAATFINARTPLAAVRQSLLAIKAAQDESAPVNHHQPAPSATPPTQHAPQSALRATSVYAKRRHQPRN